MILINEDGSEIIELIIDSNLRIIADSWDYNSSSLSNFFHDSKRISVKVFISICVPELGVI
jgi:hypothetical protein